MDFSDELGLLTQRIIGAALAVHSVLGAGFAECVYEEAMCLELGATGLAFKRQHTLDLMYRGQRVGVHRLDLLVEDVVVVELKAVDALAEMHTAPNCSRTFVPRIAPSAC